VPDLLVSSFPGLRSDATFYPLLVMKLIELTEHPYEVCQVNMAIRIQKYVVWLDVTVYYAHGVYVAEGTAEFTHPEAHGVFGEGLSRDVKA
jgi:hypothetical protein